jgi:glycosyltransferase involved in cell wall biosynthesis
MCVAGEWATLSVVARREKLSVCMAAYNGSRYIREQMASILLQMEAGDELIIVDDRSKDNTTDLVEDFADGRVRLVRNDRNCGVTRSFERALELVTGDIVFLSDQDDVWHADKVRSILAAFHANPDVTLVITGVEMIDAAGDRIPQSVGRHLRFRGGVLQTLVKNHYRGCAMAFRKCVVEATLPFPAGIPMHDSWIGLVNTIMGKTQFLDIPLVSHRRHDQNASGIRRLSVYQRIFDRWSLCTNLVWRARSLHERRTKLKARHASVS